MEGIALEKLVVSSNILPVESVKPKGLERSSTSVIPEHIDKYDIGRYPGKIHFMNDDEKVDLLNNVWETTESGPKDTKTNRRFRIAWLSKYTWLYYSKLLDGAYCINCVLFSGNAQNIGKMQQLSSVPFRDWKNAQKVFNQHENNSPHHRASVEDTRKFRENMAAPSLAINRKLDTIKNAQILKNREILKSLIKVLITMSQQAIPLRGRDESDPTAEFRSSSMETVDTTKNPGNFLAFVKLAASLDCPVLKEHLSKCAKNATYLSKDIQNELLKYIAENILDQIVAKIKQSKFFSILADEACDISNKEQMPIVIRYVDNCQIRETFVRMAECHYGCTGKGLSEIILKSIEDINLDMENCRGQGYDGAGLLIFS